MADEGDICEANGGDLCKADNSKLDKALSQTPQLPPYFNKVSHAVKTLVYIAPFLLKVKKLQPSHRKLVVCPEADSSDFCEADDS